MLNILNIKSKIKNKYFVKSSGDFKGNNRHFPSATKEWFNSIYAFNKNTPKLFPVWDEIISNLIKGYFNMYSASLNTKNDIRPLRAWKRRIYSRKFWISRPELKHSNDKVIINIYVYNRQMKHYLNKICELTKEIKFLKVEKYFIKKVRKLKKEQLKHISVPRYKSYFKVIRVNYLKSILKLRQWIKNKEKFSKQIEKYNNINLVTKKIKFSFLRYIRNYYFNIIKNNSFLIRNELFLMHYMQAYFFNKFKFNSTYLKPLIILLSKIYKKKVTFNIVKLKTYYLDSEILTQILLAKTINRKNRILRVFKSSLMKIKIPNINTRLLVREPTKFVGSQNMLIENKLENNIEHTDMNDILNNILFENSNIKEKKDSLNLLKNKTVSGIRLEASGRLTKRITAARSIFKVRYIGTLKNISSSYQGISSVILRGNIKSNLQFSKQNSKTRIGSFGLKGWISSV